LSFVVAPKAQNDSLFHDSYFCSDKFIKGSQTVPFPTQRKSGSNFTRPDEPNFIGNTGARGMAEICPQKCRPPDHLDWILC